jgi:hypothetical protein
MKDDLSTRLIHHPYRPPEGFEAVAPGVHKASTVLFPNVEALRTYDWKDKSGYTYGLHGTPTTFTLEERLATIEGGEHCMLAPSGLAVMTLVDMALLRSGDELLIPDNAYGPGKVFAEAELAAWGITHRYYDAMDPDDLARKIGPATRLVWLEAAGSITLEFPDLPALVERVHRANAARAGQRPIVTALDNTWGAGIAFQPFDLGVDVSVQALTKYPSGGADVLMGSVITRDLALHRQILLTRMRLGLGVGANDAELARSAQHGAALPRAGCQHARARHLDAAANRCGAGAAPSLAGLARPRHLAARRHGGRMPVQRGVRPGHPAGARGCVLQPPAPVPPGLELGWTDQPVRPLHALVDSHPGLATRWRSGTLCRGPRIRARPARRPGAGPERAARLTLFFTTDPKD